MKVYTVVRRFYRKGEDFIFSEIICIFDNLIKVIEYMDTENELVDNTNYLHLDTYVVSSEMNKVSTNILRQKDILRKSFNGLK
jgi:hypothetical protein